MSGVTQSRFLLVRRDGDKPRFLGYDMRWTENPRLARRFLTRSVAEIISDEFARKMIPVSVIEQSALGSQR